MESRFGLGTSPSQAKLMIGVNFKHDSPEGGWEGNRPSLWNVFPLYPHYPIPRDQIPSSKVLIYDSY